ncbi:MAG: PQQ-like beta-propeller repeat protein [Planctomycetes bacterium]|nr:PQQ-like beta-propeller repeat protein [Planctomycetota bacterium]
MHRSVVFAFVCLISISQATAENWPAWRGPRGTGVTVETDLPLKWSSTENVTWKAPLPGEGNSVPIVWDDRVFVSCPIDQGRIRSLICFDRANGKQLWRKDVPYPVKETAHRANPFCSGSPTTDGKRVYVSFGSAGVFAYDFNGKLVWHRKLGKLTHVFGQATTPVLYRNLLIVHRGPGEPTHIIALDKATGRTVWDRSERGRNHNLFGSWSTPVMVKTGKGDVLVLSLPEEIKAFDPATGKTLWFCKGLGTEIYTMAAVGDGFVVGISGHKGPAMAVRIGGRGDVTKTHRMWLTPRNGQRVGSAVIHNGYLFVANANGFAECLEAKTGKRVWRKRLGGTLWGSMLLSGDRLYVGNQQGQFFVLAAGPEYRLIARNEMKEHVKASLAPSDGQLFVHTYKNLYCIGKRKRSR